MSDGRNASLVDENRKRSWRDRHTSDVVKEGTEAGEIGTPRLLMRKEREASE